MAKKVEKLPELPEVKMDEKTMSDALGQAASRLTLIMYWAKEHQKRAEDAKWSAVAETLEGVVFNLERADALLRNEARVLERAAAQKEAGDGEA